ncbi:MAG: NIPSNAP family protein [Thermoguttaceae bacterium]
MKRREFFTVAGAAGIAASALSTADAQQGQRPAREGRSGRGSRQSRKSYIELVTYTTANLDKKEQLIKYLDEKSVPAHNRIGIKPVGVFYTNKEINDGKEDFGLNVFMLLEHKNLDSLTNKAAKLLEDKEFINDNPAHTSPMNEPLYTELKSTLMYGFDLCPVIEVPTSDPDRIFQLRFYKSYNLDRNAAKVHMFDVGGELALFRKSKMNPVFFGTTLYGDYMPNLTYMLGFDNIEAKNAAWKTFVESPEWEKMKNDPLYKDTANSIVNIMLKPSKGSQI